MMFHVEHLEPHAPPASLFQAVARELGFELTPAGLELSLHHARELLRWNATTSLVQVATWEELLRRHFAEGWVASRLLPVTASGGPCLRGLDIGSGAGFPALPASVLRPDVAFTLVEPRSRKAAFLRAVARRHPSPQPVVLESRLEDTPLEPPWDIACFRAIRLPPASILARLRRPFRVIRFPGARDAPGAEWEAAGLRRGEVLALPTPNLCVEAWQER